MKSILQPTDFSDRSRGAFRLACSLARAEGARLTVLHVSSVPDMVYGGFGAPGMPLDATEYLKTLRKKLEQLDMPEGQIPLERRLVEGDPVTEILHAAAETGANLIVMGTHGRSGLAHVLLGSVAEQVVRKAPCAVLTVKSPGDVRLPIRTILHPTDFSEPAACAFALACSLARDCGARLVVLHVDRPPVGHDAVIAHRQPEEYEKPLWDLLNRLRVPDPNVEIELRLVEGDPKTEILRGAEEEGCDLIVLGTQGRTGLPRLVVGSVAEQVLRHAGCPVLTVKAPSRR
jgi:nucleotide-binding universal stress UspA family protein